MHDRIRTRRLGIQQSRIDRLAAELETLTYILAFANERADGSLSDATALCRKLQKQVADSSSTVEDYLGILRKFLEMLAAVLAASPQAKIVLWGKEPGVTSQKEKPRVS